MKIVSLELHHFKNHTYASFHFKNTNHFFGDNFTGKTSIGDAIVFALYGVTKHGFKTYVHDFIQAGKNSMSVKIAIQLNNELLEIKRSIHGKKETLLLNNNKITQKQLSHLIGDHTLFIYSFFPDVFPEEDKKVAREFLLSLLPNQNEINEAIKSLETRMKNLLKQEKKLKQNITYYYGQLNILESEFASFKNQTHNEQFDFAKMETEKILTETNLEKMKSQIEEIRTAIASVQRRLGEIDSTLLHLQKHQELTTYEQCPLCKQMLSNEYLLSLKKEAAFSTEQLLLEKETLMQKEELLNREFRELTMKIEQLQMEIQKQNERIEQAKIQQNSQMIAKQLQQKKMEIIDTIQSKEINIQTMKTEMKLLKHQLAQVFANIQNTINNELSDSQILLFKRLKSGELRPDFQIFYKNKPYRVLSYSEKIRCMVEISSIIRHFSNRCYPIFLDNLESVTHLNPPKTQIFTASVRKGAPLQLHVK